jgi:hypothetical protein
MARTNLEKLLVEKSLNFINESEKDDALDMLIASSDDERLKNLCTKVSVNLSNRIDGVCNILNISKRRFCELAFLEAVATADRIMSEEGVYDLLKERQQEDAA